MLFIFPGSRMIIPFRLDLREGLNGSDDLRNGG